MTLSELESTLQRVTDSIGGMAPGPELMALLNERFGRSSETFTRLAEICREGMNSGWLCQREHGGIRYGRVIEAGPELSGYSVDVVYMNDVRGPYHRHPNGELDLVLPVDDGAKFDGHGAGWVVYDAESAHYPTVTGGAAFVLYLLPGGAIDFKAKPPA
ncbi:MAG: DUF4863 family protein [Myxococcales bacterium]|nr:DUF4863 family protein [Myxococcales bacterium]